MDAFDKYRFSQLFSLCISLASLYYIWSIIKTRQILRNRLKLRKKIVLITGASSGLGEECAKLFYKSGCRVILLARNMEKLLKVKQEIIDSIPQQDISSGASVEVVCWDLCDWRREEELREVLGKYQKIDVLINNAGVSYRGEIETSELSTYARLMDVNYMGTISITKVVLTKMLLANAGHIVSVSSVQGKISIPHRSAYSASKHALQAFMDSLRSEVLHRGIQVSVLSPSYIKTNLSYNALQGDGTVYNKMDKTTAEGMTTEEVAKCVLNLAVQHSTDHVVGPVFHKLAILLRNVFPSLYFKIMSTRVTKSNDNQ